MSEESIHPKREVEWLDATEAIRRIQERDHAQAHHNAPFEFEQVLIDELRAGRLQAGLHVATGDLCFVEIEP